MQEVISDSIYLNTAACGLVPIEFSQKAINHYQRLGQEGSPEAFDWLFKGGIERVREKVANFLEAPVEQVALIPNFSHGINALVQSLKGDERILLFEKDYPSLTQPFEVNNFQIEWIKAEGDGFELNAEMVEKALSIKKIDLFALSHVQWLTGALVDVKPIIELCHRYGTRVVVDVTQSLGAIPVSVKSWGVDALISSNYKWMNAGFGTGLIYQSADFLVAYPPVLGGVNSYEQTENGQKKRHPSIKDYEPGHLNLAGFAILEAAVADKKRRGVPQVYEHNRRLTQQFIDACPQLPIELIGPANMHGRSSIVVIKDKNGLGDYLMANHFMVTLRMETIRLGFHYYNDEQDVAHLIDSLTNFTPA